MVKVLIIAEAGVNHNGSLELAKRLIDVAADAGADIVKFQTFKTENIVSANTQKAEYQLLNTQTISESQFEMLKKLELNTNDHIELINHCNTRNIKFLSSPFDVDSIDELVRLGIDMFKIPSGEIDNLPYLRKIAQYNKPVILSTGMSNLSDIETSLEILTNFGTQRKNITLLHCNSEYPTPVGDVNLLAMQTIGHAFGLSVGYSDHTVGIHIPVAAVALGAQVIEKHFTLDKNMPGPDHKASLEPLELKNMICAIRDIEQALGDGIKKISVSEAKNKPIARKSIVAKKNIKVGEIFSSNNLAIKRPGDGVSPLMWDKIIGSAAQREYHLDEQITF